MAQQGSESEGDGGGRVERKRKVHNGTRETGTPWHHGHSRVNQSDTGHHGRLWRAERRSDGQSSFVLLGSTMDGFLGRGGTRAGFFIHPRKETTNNQTADGKRKTENGKNGKWFAHG